jgi:HemY protein
MAERADTRLLGLRGLFIEAQRRNDPLAARLFAEQAAKDAPALSWAGQAVLEFRCQAGDWEGALAMLESNRRNGGLDRDLYRRHRAVLLTARAIATEEDDRDLSRSLSVEATRLAADLAPAAALAGRLLAEAGERRKAAKILETAWRANPHPDIAETYANLRLSDSARDRLARVQVLVRLMPGNVEGVLAAARAALEAHELAAARAALEPLAKEPTQRVAMLMAELERLEGDEGRSREWMARALHAARDPAWTADGVVSDRWLPVSPVTGRLDAFRWRVPVSDLGEGPEPLLIEAPPPVEAPEAPKIVAPPAPEASPVPGVTQRGGAPRPPPPAPIVPLTHVPDDPGPETEVDLAAVPPPGGWQRFRQLFR